MKLAPLKCTKTQEYPATIDIDTIIRAFNKDGYVITSGSSRKINEAKHLNNNIKPKK
jgi:hypothetical protein